MLSIHRTKFVSYSSKTSCNIIIHQECVGGIEGGIEKSVHEACRDIGDPIR